MISSRDQSTRHDCRDKNLRETRGTESRKWCYLGMVSALRTAMGRFGAKEWGSSS